MQTQHLVVRKDKKKLHANLLAIINYRGDKNSISHKYDKTTMACYEK